jgi:integrase
MTKQGTLYKRKGVWHIDYTHDGKRHRLSLKTKDKLEAQRKFKELLGNPSDRSVTVGDVLKDTLEVLQLRGLKSYGVLVYHARAVEKALGTHKIGDITAAVIQDTLVKWQRKGSKPATINRRLYLLRQTLKQAKIMEYISTLPEIPRLSENGNARQGYFTEEEFWRLYVHLPYYLADFAHAAYLTGWRKSELASLTWDCIDWDAEVIRLKTSKNRESRVFPIYDKELELMLLRRFEDAKSEHVFEQENGRPVGDISTAWGTANRKAGMNKLFHDLRRTGVRNFVAMGISERHVMALCGHKTNHMLHRYHVVVEEDLKRIMQGKNGTLLAQLEVST